MPVVELFSSRGSLAPDVLRYDELPKVFRVQVCYLWASAVGPYQAPSHVVLEASAYTFWQHVNAVLCREYGRFQLAKGTNPYEQCVNHVLSAPVEEAINVIEYSFRQIDERVRSHWGVFRAAGATQSPDSAIEELNQRFAWHGLGYRYEAGNIIRVDSTYLHAEVVKPALNLLGCNGLEGANNEFRSAHEHYRHGRYEEAIHAAGNTFESVLKVICDNKRWTYERDKDAAAKLVQAVIREGLVPSWMKEGLLALPRLRNKAGHGVGSKPQKLPANLEQELAAHALHLCAANAILLAEAVRKR